MCDSVTVTLRTARPIHTALSRAADASNASMSWVIDRALRLWLEEQGFLSGDVPHKRQRARPRYAEEHAA